MNYKKVITDILGNNYNNSQVHILKVPSKSSLVVFLFLNDKKKPTLILKTPRDSNNFQHVRRETENLKAVHDHVKDSWIDKTIPFCLNQLPDNGNDKSQYLAMNVIDGDLLAHEMNYPVNIALKRKVLVESVTNWLIEYHTQTYQRTVKVDEFVQSYLMPIQDKNRDRMTETLNKVWKDAIDQLSNINNISVPITLCHGDFNPYNILVKKNHVTGVIDWADLHNNVPLIDFYNFITMLICSLPHRDYSKISNRFKLFYYQKGSEISQDIYAKFLVHFIKSLNIDPKLAHIIYQIHLVMMALKWEKGTIPHKHWDEIAQYYSCNKTSTLQKIFTTASS